MQKEKILCGYKFLFITNEPFNNLLENIDKKLPSGVYVVAVNGTIRYCGETIRSLRERFRNYINADKTQRTNIRLRNHWIYHQSIGDDVSLYFLPVENHSEIKDIEKLIIDRLQLATPDGWNREWKLEGTKNSINSMIIESELAKSKGNKTKWSQKCDNCGKPNDYPKWKLDVECGACGKNFHLHSPHFKISYCR